MTDTKLDLKNAGSIRLMELDTSTLFLPYGRPITEYLQGVGGNQNGSRARLRQGATTFPPPIRWKTSAPPPLPPTEFADLHRKGWTKSPPPPGAGRPIPTPPAF